MFVYIYAGMCIHITYIHIYVYRAVGDGDGALAPSDTLHRERHAPAWCMALIQVEG